MITAEQSANTVRITVPMSPCCQAPYISYSHSPGVIACKECGKDQTLAHQMSLKAIIAQTKETVDQSAEIARLEAELERRKHNYFRRIGILRQKLLNQRAQLRVFNEPGKGKQSEEIARLREENERYVKAINGTYKVQQELRAEVERLKGERDNAIHERDCCHEIWDTCIAIMGYKKHDEKPMLIDAVTKFVANVEQLNDEVDSWRSRVEWLQSNKGDTHPNYDKPNYQQIAQRLAGWLKAVDYDPEVDEMGWKPKIKQALADYNKLKGGGENHKKQPETKESSGSEVVVNPTDKESLTVQPAAGESSDGQEWNEERMFRLGQITILRNGIFEVLESGSMNEIIALKASDTQLFLNWLDSRPNGPVHQLRGKNAELAGANAALRIQLQAAKEQLAGVPKLSGEEMEVGYQIQQWERSKWICVDCTYTLEEATKQLSKIQGYHPNFKYRAVRLHAEVVAP